MDADRVSSRWMFLLIVSLLCGKVRKVPCWTEGCSSAAVMCSLCSPRMYLPKPLAAIHPGLPGQMPPPHSGSSDPPWQRRGGHQHSHHNSHHGSGDVRLSGGGGGGGSGSGRLGGGSGGGSGGAPAALNGDDDDTFTYRFTHLEEAAGQVLPIAKDQNGCRCGPLPSSPRLPQIECRYGPLCYLPPQTCLRGHVRTWPPCAARPARHARGRPWRLETLCT